MNNEIRTNAVVMDSLYSVNDGLLASIEDCGVSGEYQYWYALFCDRKMACWLCIARPINFDDLGERPQGTRISCNKLFWSPSGSKSMHLKAWLRRMWSDHPKPQIYSMLRRRLRLKNQQTIPNTRASPFKEIALISRTAEEIRKRIESLNVQDLKKELRKFGVKPKGRKYELRNQLIEIEYQSQVANQIRMLMHSTMSGRKRAKRRRKRRRKRPFRCPQRVK